MGNLKRLPILCIGGAGVDIKAKSLVPCVDGTKNPVRTTSCEGGVARNIAENLARLEIPVGLWSRVGQDSSGDRVVGRLRELGVQPLLIRRSQKEATATYSALLEPDGRMRIAWADMEIYEEVKAPQIEVDFPKMRRASLWVVDTNFPSAVKTVAKYLPRDVPLWAVSVSVAKVSRLKPILGQVAGVILNVDELSALVGKPLRSHQAIAKMSREIVKGDRHVLVTLGADGVLWTGKEGSTHFKRRKVSKIQDVTGAGDAFAAGVFFGLFQKMAMATAIQHGLANAELTLQTAATVRQDLTPKLLKSWVTRG